MMPATSRSIPIRSSPKAKRKISIQIARKGATSTVRESASAQTPTMMATTRYHVGSFGNGSTIRNPRPARGQAGDNGRVKSV